jgi:predicted enzyme related to lactoylglutathione lyase
MPLMETFAPGTFCWADLGSPDAAAAKHFYTSLFGWTAEDRPMGTDAVYTMLAVGGRPVAALYQQDPAQQGLPPQWLGYISVSSADAAAHRALELGGTVLMEPFDVLDVGRMALLQDPTGAVAALWEPRTHAGAAVVGEPGSIGWNELHTNDVARAGRFYQALFGWTVRERPLETAIYTTFSGADGPRGGMRSSSGAGERGAPHWLIHFAVTDCAASAAGAEALGGTVRLPPTHIPEVGRFALLADPQGADFAVIQFS